VCPVRERAPSLFPSCRSSSRAFSATATAGLAGSASRTRVHRPGISSHGVLTALRFPTELLLAYSQGNTYKPRIKSSFKATRDGRRSGGELEGSRAFPRSEGSMLRKRWTLNETRLETRAYRENAGIRPHCGSTDGELQRGIVGIAPRRRSRCISQESRKFSGKLWRIREGEIRARRN
jgi:hypothetical protein